MVLWRENGWEYGEDERGSYCTHKDYPSVKYRSLPQGGSNRRLRRSVGIRNPLVVLEDYRQTQEALRYDAEG